MFVSKSTPDSVSHMPTNISEQKVMGQLVRESAYMGDTYGAAELAVRRLVMTARLEMSPLICQRTVKQMNHLLDGYRQMKF